MTNQPNRFDAIVIGGGFFGLRIALHLSKELNFKRVALVEASSQLMNRSSFNNQARVHNGYHYPRSILTAARSRVNAPMFIQEYSDAISTNFSHYYAIPKRQSKTDYRQFHNFSNRIGAHIEPATEEIKRHFSSSFISEVFLVSEPAFDSRIIREKIMSQLSESPNISVFMNSEVKEVLTKNQNSYYVVTTQETLFSPLVFNATYSQINSVNSAAGVETFNLQHEITEMPLVKLPDSLSNMAITVMDGPFFSVMPFPSTDFSSLSHVRYTPHLRWKDEAMSRPVTDPTKELHRHSRESNFIAMKSDAARYIPAMHDAVHQYSLWESKTVLASSDSNDSRPILYRKSKLKPGFFSIMGGKLDNVYDVLIEISKDFGKIQ